MKTRPHLDSHKRQELSVLTNRLRRQSRNVTGPRRAILDILRKHPHPLTNREILAALPKGRCDLATIYRTMHLLAEMGLVNQFDFGDGKARFELAGEVGDRHHHHLVCTNCSEIVEIGECILKRLEKQIAAQNVFAAVTHKLEFFGVCPDCLKSEAGLPDSGPPPDSSQA